MTLSHHRDASRQPLDNASAPPAGLHPRTARHQPPRLGLASPRRESEHMTPARQPGSQPPHPAGIPGYLRKVCRNRSCNPSRDNP
jgi:hypothetical protein